MIKLQVTLFNSTGEYRPISTILKVESLDYYYCHKAEIQKKAILNIMANRHLSYKELIKDLNYNKVKVREYDIDKIEQRKERQRQIQRIQQLQQRRQQQRKDKN